VKHLILAGFMLQHCAAMNRDPTVIVTILIFAAAFFAMLRLVPVEARMLLGRRIERYSGIPESELEMGLEQESKAAFFSIEGVLVVLLGALLWHAALTYSYPIQVALKARGVAGWIAVCVGGVPFFLGPLFANLSSRWLIRRRLDRRFAERLAT
jgi:hypothetical protein